MKDNRFKITEENKTIHFVQSNAKLKTPEYKIMRTRIIKDEILGCEKYQYSLFIANTIVIKNRTLNKCRLIFSDLLDNPKLHEAVIKELERQNG